MENERVQEILDLFSLKQDGNLRGLFYTKKGLPRQKLYTKDQMMNLLGVPDDLNQLEYIGARAKLSNALSLIRGEAKQHGLPFVDFHASQVKGRDIAYHGFMQDIDKIEATINLYNQRADQSKHIAEVTQQTMESVLMYIDSDKQEHLMLN